MRSKPDSKLHSRGMALALNAGFLTLLLLGSEFDVALARIGVQIVVWGCLLLYTWGLVSDSSQTQRLRPIVLYISIDILALVLMFRAGWYLSSLAYMLSMLILEIRNRRSN
jgi:hypothetical protein